jgi:hypothetical protein
MATGSSPILSEPAIIDADPFVTSRASGVHGGSEKLLDEPDNLRGRFKVNIAFFFGATVGPFFSSKAVNPVGRSQPAGPEIAAALAPKTLSHGQGCLGARFIGALAIYRKPHGYGD